MFSMETQKQFFRSVIYNVNSGVFKVRGDNILLHLTLLLLSPSMSSSSSSSSTISYSPYKKKEKSLAYTTLKRLNKNRPTISGDFFNSDKDICVPKSLHTLFPYLIPENEIETAIKRLQSEEKTGQKEGEILADKVEEG